MAKHSFGKFSTAVMLTVAAAIVGCSAQAAPEVTVPFLTASQVKAIGDVPVIDPFLIAYGQANQAVAAAETAKTASEWATAKDLWTSTIKLMELVPETSPDYATAQEKAIAYADNFSHSQKQWAKQLVAETAGYLDAQGNWKDRDQGREHYDALKSLDGEVVTEALVSQIRRSSHRKQVLFLSVKLGIRQSEEALINALMSYGTEAMAEDFLNSGSIALAEGGERWAIARGYEILNNAGGSNRTTWGSF